ncbi:hypothetical protein BMS3Abin14_00199 [bacterium BMS3Abin14]|nr:hypothetical protein BMS3Abin14_00199 [bacterium BMS3Abin14]
MKFEEKAFVRFGTSVIPIESIVYHMPHILGFPANLSMKVESL